MKKQSIFKNKDTGVIKERLSVSDYLVSDQFHSRIDEGAILVRVVGMKCPHCGTKGEEIEHGHIEVCVKCGLVMEVHGNALDCTLDTFEPNYAKGKS